MCSEIKEIKQIFNFKIEKVVVHTEFCVVYSEMMILFFLEFINSDYTILSDLVSHFQKGITLGVYFEYYELNEYLIFENIKY